METILKLMNSYGIWVALITQSVAIVILLNTIRKQRLAISSLVVQAVKRDRSESEAIYRDMSQSLFGPNSVSSFWNSVAGQFQSPISSTIKPGRFSPLSQGLYSYHTSLKFTEKDLDQQALAHQTSERFRAMALQSAKLGEDVQLIIKDRIT